MTKQQKEDLIKDLRKIKTLAKDIAEWSDYGDSGEEIANLAKHQLKVLEN